MQEALPQVSERWISSCVRVVFQTGAIEIRSSSREMKILKDFNELYIYNIYTNIFLFIYIYFQKYNINTV